MPIDIESHLPPIWPSDFEIAFDFFQMWVAVCIEPYANRARRAHQLAVDDLQTARIAGVFRIVPLVKIPINTSQRSANFRRESARLLGNRAYPEHFAFGQRRGESDVLALAVDFYNVD